LLGLGPALAQQDGGARITPNFKDADITQIIEAVSAATGKNFIIDPRVRAQVTMLSSTPMTPDQFYQAFLAILQVHGFAALPAGNVIKVLPDQNIRQFPGNDLPERISGTSDEMVTQVLAVKNVNAAQLVPVLRPLMPQNGQLAAVTGSNMLIISDRAGNVNRLMRIIARIDQVGNSDIDVVPLQSATAADTVRVLNSLLTGQVGGEAGTAPVRIVADDRSNSILVSGDQAQRLRIKTLIAHLDTPLDSGSETQVRYLRYADAEDLAGRLKGQLTGSGTSGSSGSAARGPAQPAATPASTGPATVSLEGGMATIWADKDTNALVITAGQRTMRALNAVVDKLDIRRAQVLVQAIIVEVSADKSAELGVNWVVDGSNNKLAAGGFIEPIGGTSIIDLYTAASSGTVTAAPLGTTIGIGRLAASGINFAAVLRALQGDSRTNIIATPSVQTQDNQEAKIEVAQEVPFVTGQYTGSTGTTSAFQTIQRQSVGTLLTVTPQINEGDAVLLKIQVESSSIAATSIAAADIITNKRTISTNVLIKDGGTLVLGGLIQDSSTNAEQRVPLFGRIPVIGELFRTRSTSKKKSNLMVFIQPRILRDDQAAAIETNSKYQYMREQQQRTNRESTLLPLLPFEKPAVMPPLAPAAAAPELAVPTPAPSDSATAKDSPP
jgi:general secretion pathway protein D